jgi:hypothetical protein
MSEALKKQWKSENWTLETLACRVIITRFTVKRGSDRIAVMLNDRYRVPEPAMHNQVRCDECGN